MEIIKIKQLIETSIISSEAIVSGDGHHFQALVISDSFAELNKVKRQQRVYQALQEYITSGELHAISLQTFTLEEYNKIK